LPKNVLLLSGTTALPVTPRFGGVAGAIRTEPPIPAATLATRADKSLDRPREVKALFLPSTGQTWRNFAILGFVLASAMLLLLAALEPVYAVERFGLARALESHRRQVALSGWAFLAAAGLLFLVSRL
jgi:LPXTG-motif cell wall-anchored protein